MLHDTMQVFTAHYDDDRRDRATVPIARAIRRFLQKDPSLRPRYALAKKIRGVARQSANYDVTSRCNLFCEGCFYFEGNDYKRAREQRDISTWVGFFRDQAARGVTFVNIAGAEPALVQNRIAAAYAALPRGSVFTNGTIKIDHSIGYTVLISLWGDEQTTTIVRGGGVFWKALKNYRGDPRARILFTVHARNIEQISSVAKIVDDNGMRLSFNYFSPTDTYLDKIEHQAPNDAMFFRLSSRNDNLILTPEALCRARAAIDDVIDRYPRTLIHSHAFNRVATSSDGMHDIDPETGIARDCYARNFRWHHSYRVDLKLSDAKCCTPNVDCKQCRLSAPALGSLVFQQEKFIGSIEQFRNWLDICKQWGRSHLLDADCVWKTQSESTYYEHPLRPAHPR